MIITNALLAQSGSPDALFDISIENEIIRSVDPAGKLTTDRNQPGDEIIDAAGRPVIPGMIDPHVHMRCPGMEQKEDWLSGSRAAIAGGVTTVIDMPNTKPPTETLEALGIKREAAARADEAGTAPSRLYWVGTSPEHLKKLPELLAESDVAGLKLFFSETSSNTSSSDIGFISRAFSIAAESGKPAAVHSELGPLLSPFGTEGCEGLPLLVQHNRRRTGAAAVAGTALALELAAVAGCRLYLCHLSTLAELAMVRKHKEAFGIDSIIAELTPHHLLLNEDHNVFGGNPAWAKVNPPLRVEADREAAAAALLDGTIDLIGSDHAPHRLEEKDMPAQDFFSCPSGFPGLETELGLIAGFLREAAESEWLSTLKRLTSARAGEVFELTDRAEISAGKRADLVILGDEQEISAPDFNTKARYSPFNGMKMPVSVYKTIVGGRIGK